MIHIIAFSAFFTAYSQSDFFGKGIFLSLFFLSILSWLILIQKIQYSRRLHLENHKLINFFDKHREELLDISLSHITFDKHPYIQLYYMMKSQTLEILSKNRFYTSSEERVYLSAADMEMMDPVKCKEYINGIKVVRMKLFNLLRNMT